MARLAIRTIDTLMAGYHISPNDPLSNIQTGWIITKNWLIFKLNDRHPNEWLYQGVLAPDFPTIYRKYRIAHEDELLCTYTHLGSMEYPKPRKQKSG